MQNAATSAPKTGSTDNVVVGRVVAVHRTLLPGGLHRVVVDTNAVNLQLFTSVSSATFAEGDMVAVGLTSSDQTMVPGRWTAAGRSRTYTLCTATDLGIEHRNPDRVFVLPAWREAGTPYDRQPLRMGA